MFRQVEVVTRRAVVRSVFHDIHEARPGCGEIAALKQRYRLRELRAELLLQLYQRVGVAVEYVVQALTRDTRGGELPYAAAAIPSLRQGAERIPGAYDVQTGGSGSRAPDSNTPVGSFFEISSCRNANNFS